MLELNVRNALPALKVCNLQKHFGALHVTQGVDLCVREGELHALIGPNGAGKSTLIGQIRGEVMPDAGTIEVFGHDITHLPPYRRSATGLAGSFQISQLYSEFSAEDNVAMAVQARSPGGANLWTPARTDVRLREPARRALTEVGLIDRAAVRAGELAHGERRQLELAMALALNARVLLLDEPLAGMGPEESRRTTALLQQFKGRYSILLVEHDMDAVFALADTVTVLVYGKTIFTGTPEQARRDPAVRAAYLGGE